MLIKWQVLLLLNLNKNKLRIHLIMYNLRVLNNKKIINNHNKVRIINLRLIHKKILQDS